MGGDPDDRPPRSVAQLVSDMRAFVKSGKAGGFVVSDVEREILGDATFWDRVRGDEEEDLGE